MSVWRDTNQYLVFASTISRPFTHCPVFASTISRPFTHCPVHFYVCLHHFPFIHTLSGPLLCHYEHSPPFPVYSHTVRCLSPPFPVHSHTFRSTSMFASTISRPFTHCPVHFYVTMNTLHHFPSIHTLSGPLLCHYEHSPPFPVHSHTVWSTSMSLWTLEGVGGGITSKFYWKECTCIYVWQVISIFF